MLRWPALFLPLALACAAQVVAAGPATGVAPELSAAEVSRVLALGPWPPALRPDPSNRVSGQPLAIELGRRLFNDPRMSPVGYIACVSCHQTDRAFTDNKARAHGLGDLPRNTPGLANLRLQNWFGWGGASDSLWMASLQPMLDAREFDSNPAVVARIYRRDAELAACYRAVFKSPPSGDAERVMVNTAKALAAFQETLRTGRTAFDDFRDALARGDAAAAARYPPSAQRGLKLFVGSLGCVACHAGPNLSDGGFHAGLPGAASGGDAGRHDDLRKHRASAFNLEGRYNDSPGSARTRALGGEIGAFRTPSLRNVAVTAPYLHDGSADTLRDALAHRHSADPSFGAQQREDLLAFLGTLTDAHGARRPAATRPLRCPG